MDTEEIATEIVRIRRRLAELDDRVEGHHDNDSDDERTRLHDRLRHLQDVMSSHAGRNQQQDSPAQPDSVHYVPPA
ncbi:MAG TPA: hypothetical protein VK969_14205 [Acidimicrobiia bacterium]|nr:hypothetical protein [Acidimicrobiia bacterium]